MYFKVAAAALLLVCASSGSPDLYILSAPARAMQSDTVSIEFTTVPGPAILNQCLFHYQTSPQGSQLQGHTSAVSRFSLDLQPENKNLWFIPEALNSQGLPQVPAGTIYYIVACTDSLGHSHLSQERSLVIESNSKPVILFPQDITTDPAPLISWQAVPGVPATHVMISDQLVDIEDKTYSLTGLSIIWQAITTKSSILYGSPDPSGFFPYSTPPPLSPGVRYTLILLNNYDGKSITGSSEKVRDFRVFEIEGPEDSPFPVPRNIQPAQDDTLNEVEDASVRFSWTSSGARALYYRLFVYSSEQYPGFDSRILIPVWNTETTDTTAILEAAQTLFNRRYYYKVFAVSESGASVTGDTSSFFYQIKTERVSFLVTAKMGSPLEGARISAVSLNGSQDVLPLLTDKNGNAYRDFNLDLYQFQFEMQGYRSESRSIDLRTIDSGTTVSVQLNTFSAQITGRVSDNKGEPVFNAEISGEDESGGTFSANTNAQGLYQLGLEPGAVRVRVRHPAYLSGIDTIITINSEQHLFQSDFMLTRVATSLTGRTLSSKGLPVAGVLVKIVSDSGKSVYSMITDINGEFSFPLKKGSYRISAEKTGFSDYQKNLTFLSNQFLEIRMASGAAIIRGRVDMLNRLEPTYTTRAPCPDAELRLFSQDGGDTLLTATGKTGDYHFSVSPGKTYFLKAQLPGRTTSALDTLTLPKAPSTFISNVSLFRYARIQGTVIFTGSPPDGSRRPTLFLASREGVPPITSTKPDDMGRYTFKDVADGDYVITGGMPGWGLSSAPAVSVRGQVWMLDVNLSFIPSSTKLKFRPASNGLPLPAQIFVKTPFGISLDSRDSIENAAPGIYIISSIPLDRTVLPLTGYVFSISGSGPSDTTIQLEHPFRHVPADSNYRKGKLTVMFSNSAPMAVDSAYIVYGYNTPGDTLRFHGPFSSLNETAVTVPPEGGILRYYLVIFSGGQTYANSSPAGHYTVPIPASSQLAALRFNVTDPMELAVGIPARIRVDGFDAAGTNINRSIKNSGRIVWEAGGADLELDTLGGLEVAVKAGRTLSTSLTVTVQLKNAILTSALTVRAVKGRVNKIELTSSQGQNMDVSPEDMIELYAAGLDTSVQPPVRVMADITFSLVPPEAGRLKNSRLYLDPDFIGPIRILAALNTENDRLVTELGIEKDSLSRGLNVAQTIDPNGPGRNLFNGSLLRMVIDSASLSGQEPVTLRIRNRDLVSVFKSMKDKFISGKVYEILPSRSRIFSTPPLLKFGIPGKRKNSDFDIAIFDTHRLDWMEIPDTLIQQADSTRPHSPLTLPLSLFDGYYYTLLEKEKPLSVTGFTIVPNPFSPLIKAESDGNTEYGAKISFQPRSNESTSVIVTLKIYNTRGELVRVLERYRSQPKSVLEYYWDGKTDQGLWARNGRYVAMLLLKESVTQKTIKFMAPVVLFK